MKIDIAKKWARLCAHVSISKIALPLPLVMDFDFKIAKKERDATLTLKANPTTDLNELIEKSKAFLVEVDKIKSVSLSPEDLAIKKAYVYDWHKKTAHVQGFMKAFLPVEVQPNPDLVADFKRKIKSPNAVYKKNLISTLRMIAFVFGVNLWELRRFRDGLLGAKWDKIFQNPCQQCDGARVHLHHDFNLLTELRSAIEEEAPKDRQAFQKEIELYFPEFYAMRGEDFFPFHIGQSHTGNRIVDVREFEEKHGSLFSTEEKQALNQEVKRRNEVYFQLFYGKITHEEYFSRMQELSVPSTSRPRERTPSRSV